MHDSLLFSLKKKMPSVVSLNLSEKLVNPCETPFLLCSLNETGSTSSRQLLSPLKATAFYAYAVS
jgi:hypothetical protein